MKRNLAYAAFGFLFAFVWVLAIFIVPAHMGTLPWSDFTFALGMGSLFGVILGGIVFVVARSVRKNDPIAASATAFTKPMVLIGTTLVLAGGVYAGHTAFTNEGAKASEIKARNNRMEAEKARVAALTPQQRATEEATRKAAVERTQEASRMAAAKKAAAENEKNVHLQMAGVGALTLKKSAKDPEAFVLKSAYVAPSGATCYQYRAKNGFGATFPGEAVLTSKGKLLIREHDGNAFVAAWNTSCTKAGGEDVAPYINSIGLLNN